MGYISIFLAIFLWSSLGIVVRLSGAEVHLLIFYSLLVSIFAQGVMLLKKKNQAASMDLKNFISSDSGKFSLLNNSHSIMLFKYHHCNAVLTHYTAPIM
jgi:hypothetical protein